MSDRQETTADIIAAMRDEAARADMEQEYSIDDAAEMMREFAWRFEAAHKREAVTDCNQLREALENSNGLLEELAAIGEWGESARGQIAENNAALATTSNQNT